MRTNSLALLALLAASGCADGPTTKDDTDTDAAGETDTDGQDTDETDVQPTGECADFDPMRRAFFGDVHVHTSWSFDSYVLRNTANDPEVAYRFGAGEQVPLPPFEDDLVTPQNGRMIQLRTPLDFMAVTDHSEFYAEVDYCTTPPMPNFQCDLPRDAAIHIYCTVECFTFRTKSVIDEFAGIDLAFVEWSDLLGTEPPERNQDICNNDENGVMQPIDCASHAADIWQEAQAITDAANDPCEFTALKGYEYSRALGDDAAMLHRNIIYRSSDVPPAPITLFEAGDPYEMLAETRDACEAVDGCEFLSIPHNSNLSYGLMFQVEDAEDGLLLTEENARLRATHEPLVEMVQIKGASECRNYFDRFSADYDEFCEFEPMPPTPLCSEPGADPDNCILECDPTVPNTGVNPDEDGKGGVPSCLASTNMVRNAMKEALVQEERLGFNPFKLGFIASTDTHNGTPGATDEETFQGSHGNLDDEPAEHVDQDSSIMANIENPGGLAVVWAEENTRASIFDAMMRKETYGTSGTRIIHRFFGGWDLPSDLCDDPDLVATAYEAGVPMGGTLEAASDSSAPSFLTWATRAADVTDPSGTTWPGTPLQRIQIIKVWTDAAGTAHEEVYDATPSPDNGADVNLNTCAISNTGADELCAVWTDPDYDPTERAAYYTRVLEDPTCRWSWHVCLENQGDWDCSDPEADEYWEGCCSANVPKTVQERAWGSPIWIDPS